MRPIGRVRFALGAAARAVAAWSAVMLVVSTAVAVTGWVPAAAADGPQGALTVEPASVATAADGFALRPPADSRCEEDGTGSGADNTPGPRTGADGWRWHAFIVEAGRDVSTLRFEPLGPGVDFDATDGSITAPLYAASGEPVIQMLPALRPEGHINPDELAGLVLDPSIYTLADGEYTVGFACTDGGLEPRQWWTASVTIDTDGTSFLTGPSAEGDGAPRDTAAAGSATDEAASTTADAASPATTVVSASEPAASGAPDDPLDSASGESADSDGATSSTGVSWAPLVALVDASGLLPIGVWAALGVVFARIAYLLAKPVHIVPVLAP